jgi:hypothetical protein
MNDAELVALIALGLEKQTGRSPDWCEGEAWRQWEIRERRLVPPASLCRVCGESQMQQGR